MGIFSFWDDKPKKDADGDDDLHGLDDIDFDDFGFDAELPDDKRKPSSTFSTFAKSTVGSFKDAEMEDTLKRALPSQYGEVFNTKDEIVSAYRDVTREATKEFDRYKNDFKRLTNTALDHAEKILPESLVKHLREFAKKDEDSGYQQESESAIIGTTLAEIFDKQTKVDEARELKKQRKDDIKSIVEHNRHNSIYAELDAIRRSNIRLVNYNEAIQLKYQRKDLEASLKRTNLLFRLVEETSAMRQEAKSVLASINKNTSLPDYVKLRGSEVFMATAKQKFYSDALDSVFQSKRFIPRFIQEARDAATGWTTNLISGLAQGVQGVNDAIDMVSGFGDDSFGPPKTKAQMAGDMAGMAVGDFIRKNTLGRLQKFLSGQSTIFGRKFKYADKLNKGGYGAQLILENAPYYFNKLEDKLRNVPILGSMMEIVGDVARRAKGGYGTSVNQASFGDLSKPGVFTNRVAKSITDVIPGFLSLILKEIASQRAGREVEALKYDYTSDTFKSFAGMKKQILEKTVSRDLNKSFHDNVEYISDEIDPNHQLDQKAWAAIARQVNQDSRNSNININAAYFQDPNRFKDLTLEQKKIARRLFRDFLKKDNGEKTLALRRKFGSIIPETNRLQEWLQNLTDSSYLEELKATGLIDQNRQVNLDRLFQLITSEDIESEYRNALTSDYRNQNSQDSGYGPYGGSPNAPGGPSPFGPSDSGIGGPWGNPSGSPMGPPGPTGALGSETNPIILGYQRNYRALGKVGDNWLLNFNRAGSLRDSLTQRPGDTSTPVSPATPPGITPPSNMLALPSPDAFDRAQQARRDREQQQQMDRLRSMQGYSLTQYGAATPSTQRANISSSMQRGPNITLDPNRVFMDGRSLDELFFASQVGSLEIESDSTPVKKSIIERIRSLSTEDLKRLPSSIRDKIKSIKLKDVQNQLSKYGKKVRDITLDDIVEIGDTAESTIRSNVQKLLKRVDVDDIKNKIKNEFTKESIDKRKQQVGDIYEEAKAKISRDGIKSTISSLTDQAKANLKQHLLDKADPYKAKAENYIRSKLGLSQDDSILKAGGSKALDYSKNNLGAIAKYGAIGLIAPSLLPILGARALYRSYKDKQEGTTSDMASGDIYIPGEDKPRLLSIILKNGGYFNQDDGKPIHSFEDITGNVVNENGEVLLSKDEIQDAKVVGKKGLVADLVGMTKLAGSKYTYGVKKFTNLWFNPLKKATTKITGREAADVYVVGKSTPVLTKAKMESGLYFNIDTGIPVKYPTQIHGAIGELDPNDPNNFTTVLTVEDIQKGLFRSNGKPIRVKLASKIEIGLNNLKKSLSNMPGKALSGIKSGLSSYIDKVKNAPDPLEGQYAQAGSPSLSQMVKSSPLYWLGTKLFGRKKGDIDGDGDVDNSVEDIQQKRKGLGSKIKDALTRKGKSKSKSKGLLGMIGSILKSGMGMLVGGIASVIGFGVKKAFGLLGLAAKPLLKGFGKAMWKMSKFTFNRIVDIGKFMLNRIPGILKAATWAGRGLVGAASAVGGAVAAAVPAAAVGATVYGGYKAVKGIYTGRREDQIKGGTTLTGAAIGTAILPGLGTLIGAAIGYGVGAIWNKARKWSKGNKLSEMESVRFAMYGFNYKDKKDQTFIEPVMTLELMFEEALVKNGDKWDVDPSKISEEDLMKLFNLNPYSPQESMALVHDYLEKRFKPAFLVFVTALRALTNDSKVLEYADRMKDIDKLKLINALRAAPVTIYQWMKNPFTTAQLSMDGGRVVDSLAYYARDLKDKLNKEVSKDGMFTGMFESKAETSARKREERENLDKEIEDNAAMKSVESTIEGASKNNLVEAKVPQEDHSPIKIDTDRGTVFIDAFAAVRFKTYGIVSMKSIDKIQSLVKLEQAIEQADQVKVEDNVATFTGKIHQLVSHFMKIDPYVTDYSSAKKYLEKRFLPVYLKYRAMLFLQNFKTSDDLKKIDLLRIFAKIYIAREISGTISDDEQNALLTDSGESVWDITISPWRGYELNTKSYSVTDNLNFLRAKAKTTTVEETKSNKELQQDEANDNKQVTNKLMASIKDTGNTGRSIANIGSKAMNKTMDAFAKIKASAGVNANNTTSANNLPIGLIKPENMAAPGGQVPPPGTEIKSPMPNKLTGNPTIDAALQAKLYMVGNGKNGPIYGSNNRLMNQILAIESKGRANAVSPNGAYLGIGQMGSDAWRDASRFIPGLPPFSRQAAFDPGLNFAALKGFMIANHGYVKGQVPMDDPVGIYLAHQQGNGGARAIFNAARYGGMVNGAISRNMRSNAPGLSSVTPLNFINYWKNRIVKDYNNYASMGGTKFEGDAPADSQVADMSPSDVGSAPVPYADGQGGVPSVTPSSPMIPVSYAPEGGYSPSMGSDSGSGGTSTVSITPSGAPSRDILGKVNNDATIARATAPTAGSYAGSMASGNVLLQQSEQSYADASANGKDNLSDMRSSGSSTLAKKAADIATRNAKGASTGYCASFVRKALMAAGYKIKSWPEEAYQYADGMLARIGFKEIKTNDYLPGDVIVYGCNKAHPHGHIQIFNGRNWVSDWVQRSVYPYRSQDGGAPSIWRDMSGSNTPVESTTKVMDITPEADLMNMQNTASQQAMSPMQVSNEDRAIRDYNQQSQQRVYGQSPIANIGYNERRIQQQHQQQQSQYAENMQTLPGLVREHIGVSQEQLAVMKELVAILKTKSPEVVSPPKEMYANNDAKKDSSSPETLKQANIPPYFAKSPTEVNTVIDAKRPAVV